MSISPSAVTERLTLPGKATSSLVVTIWISSPVADTLDADIKTISSEPRKARSMARWAVIIEDNNRMAESGKSDSSQWVLSGRFSIVLVNYTLIARVRFWQ